MFYKIIALKKNIVKIIINIAIIAEKITRKNINKKTI